jgi:hypothetical protein
MKYPVTPDGRYFVVRGRLWRMSNPHLPEAVRNELVKTLMTARRDIAPARRLHDGDAEREARARVDAAKISLGERGPVWWNDGAPDHNRKMAANSHYAEWYSALQTDTPAS